MIDWSFVLSRLSLVSYRFYVVGQRVECTSRDNDVYKHPRLLKFPAPRVCYFCSILAATQLKIDTFGATRIEL